MSVLNANCLAIYFDGTGSTSKYTVNNDYADLTAVNAGVTDAGLTIYVTPDKRTFITFASYSSGTGTAGTLTLAAAATSSTLDLSNAVEDVARDGSGGTLQESETSWSISADGLVKGTDDTGEDFLDLARDNKYVLLKFEIDDVLYFGQALIDNVSVTGAVDEIATYSISLTGVDELYKA
jgi:predicted secreted protein